MEAITYVDSLKKLSENDIFKDTLKKASYKKRNILEDRNNTFLKELNNQPTNIKYHSKVFKRRYKQEHLENFYAQVLKFAGSSGYDLTNKEIFIYNKKFHNKCKDGTPKFVKIEVPYVSTQRLLDHFLANFTDTYTYAFRLHEHTTIFVLDIDFRNQGDLYKKTIISKTADIIEYLGGEPFFLEYSENSEGYHIYFDYGEYFSNQKFKNIEKVLKKKFGLEVEIKKKGDILRLPLSVQYRREAGTFNPEKEYLIDQKSLAENIEIYNNHTPSKTPWILNRIQGQTLKHGKYVGEISKESFCLDSSDFSYGCGTRHQTQIKIAFALLYKDINTSFQDFIKECEKWNDGTSKDMRLPEFQRNKKLIGIWDWCKDSFKEVAPKSTPDDKVNDRKTYDYLYGSEDIRELTPKEWDIINSELKSAFMRLKPGKRKGAFEKRFLFDCMVIMEYLISMDQYRKLNGYKYEDEKYEYLNKGCPIGDKLKFTIAEHFRIKNIKKVFKFLEDSGFLIRIFSNEGYSHSYKGITHSTHFSINYFIINSILYNSNNNSNFSSSPPGYPDYIYNIANFLNKAKGLNGKHLFERLETIRKLKELGKIPDFNSS